jgi:predicted esterase
MRATVCVATAMALFTMARAETEIHVPYIPQPVIDGRLDASLDRLESHEFPVRQATATLPTGWAPRYRIGYTADSLYLYIEVPEAQLATRDRAYQNGDGYLLVLTIPRADGSPSDEFSVLGFTASGKPLASWQNKIRWYHNVDVSFEVLREAETATVSENGHTGMELRLPWSTVAPLHPWLTQQIGFNLSYIKAEGETDTSQFLVLDDEKIDAEQSPRRSIPLRFAAPAGAEFHGFVALSRNHLKAGETAEAQIAVYSPGPLTVRAAARVMNGEQEIVAARATDLKYPGGLVVQTLALPTSSLPADGYSVRWGGDLERLPPSGLSLLPTFDAAVAERRIEENAGRITAGSRSTLLFKLEQVKEVQARLHAYDTAGNLRSLLAQFEILLAQAERGNDVLAAQRGTLRRAFRSKIDGTLQPYTVHLPSGLVAANKRPLIVFLHGSGEDDRDVLSDDDAIILSMFPPNAIMLAPFGRGTSNCFTKDHAQDDIREAIEDVMTNYPVDSSRVVLAGFSMGGYGAYRTFDSDRKRYRAVAIFSGHPSIGREWFGNEAPDYLDGTHMEAFRNADIFIFHGGKDRSAPFELTQEMVAKLRFAGARVTFEFAADKGHELPPPTTIAAFQSWLQRVLR